MQKLFCSLAFSLLATVSISGLTGCTGPTAPEQEQAEPEALEEDANTTQSPGEGEGSGGY